MWYKNENGDLTRPADIDSTLSKKYVYVRKDFKQIEATEEIPAHWEWLETKVLKEDWEIYQNVIEHGNALDDVYAALTELAELIEGGN